MGFGAGKISGHGTEFKHRKAIFKQLKPLVSKIARKAAFKPNSNKFSFAELQKVRAEQEKVHFNQMLRICIPCAILLAIFMYYMM